MAGRQGLEHLNQRKQALVLESDLNRMTLRVELENLRAATAPLDQAAATARRMAPWLLPLAPLAGLLAVHYLRRGSRPLNVLMSMLRWAAPVMALWRRFAVKEKPCDDEAD
jgi:hypothetical protein